MTDHPALDMSGLIAAGLPASDVTRWRVAQPSFTEPGKASGANLPPEAETLRVYVERGHDLTARLPGKPARTPGEQAAAGTVHNALRHARLEFLRAYAALIYAQLTDNYCRSLRADDLAERAAERYPGLVPTRAAVLAERRHAQPDKDAGAELDQGLFFWKVLESERAGLHLIHAMQAPKPESVQRLAAFRASGEADLGVAHVARRGKAGVVELRNLRYLNAEDNAAVAALETAVDLVILHPDLEAGVLRGGIVDHPKHAGRRIFQSGANLTHLYGGQMGLVEFFLTRELGYINKMYRGLAGPHWVAERPRPPRRSPGSRRSSHSRSAEGARSRWCATGFSARRDRTSACPLARRASCPGSPTFASRGSGASASRGRPSCSVACSRLARRRPPRSATKWCPPTGWTRPSTAPSRTSRRAGPSRWPRSARRSASARSPLTRFAATWRSTSGNRRAASTATPSPPTSRRSGPRGAARCSFGARQAAGSPHGVRDHSVTGPAQPPGAPRGARSRTPRRRGRPTGTAMALTR